MGSSQNGEKRIIYTRKVLGKQTHPLPEESGGKARKRNLDKNEGLPSRKVESGEKTRRHYQ